MPVDVKQKAKTTQNTPVRNGDRALKNEVFAGTTGDADSKSAVKDRILQWQSTINSGNSREDSEEVRKVPEKLSAEAAREDPNRETASGGEEGEGENVTTPKGKKEGKDVQAAATTPRKRIISDERWRKVRSAAADKAAATQQQNDTPLKPGKSSANKRTSSGRADAWVRRKSNTGKVAQDLDDAMMGEDSPIRPLENAARNDTGSLGTQLGSSNRAKDWLSSKLSTFKSEDAQTRTIRPSSAPSLNENEGVEEPPPPVSKMLSRGHEDTRKVEQRSPEPKSIRRPKRESYENRPTRASRQSQGEQDSEPQPPHTAFGSRIESWLTGTPDPFVEDVDQLAANIASPASASEAESVPRNRKRSSRRRSRKYDDDESRNFHLPSRDNEDRKQSRVSRENSPVAERRKYQDDQRNNSRGSKDEQEEANSPASNLKRSDARRRASSYANDRAHSPQKHLQHGLEITHEPTAKKDSVALSTSVPKEDDPWSWNNRTFPTTGKRLSTIASVDSNLMSPQTRDTAPDASRLVDIPEEKTGTRPKSAVKPDTKDKQNVTRPDYQRNLTSHEDLLSVLSMPKRDRVQKLPAAGVKSVLSITSTPTLDDLMNELKIDETKYMRELKTLVNGVIPVLLSCVLSQSQSAIAAGLFRNKSESSATTAIVNIGVALERLKSTHTRVPLTNPDSFVTWAIGASRIYEDYLKSWRMGFQDVVVNLAPSDKNPAEEKLESDKSDIMAKDDDGFIVNSDGAKVDVAYLLKRPLVRLKYLAKTLKGIEDLKHTKQAEKSAGKFEELVKKARRRQDEERARLEDEAAASIDATRAREPETLAPLAGVSIDRDKNVRARDYFDMNLQHSSGQRYDCRVELLLRESASKDSSESDLLVCEVGDASRWLLFPPLQLTAVSSRQGNSNCEIVVMIRGWLDNGQEWQELMTLSSSMEHICHEWIDMLGVTPVPPGGSTHKPDNTQALVVAAPSEITAADPKEIEIPIGEQASEISKRWDGNSPNKTVDEYFQGHGSTRKGMYSDYKPATQNSRHYSLPPGISGPTTKRTYSYDTTSLSLSDESRRSHTEENRREKRYSQPQLSLPRSSRIEDVHENNTSRIRRGVSSERKRIPVYSTDSSPTRPAQRPMHDRRRPPSSPSVMKSQDIYRRDLPRDYPIDYMPLPSERSRSDRPPLHRRKSPNPSEELPHIPRTRNTDMRRGDERVRPSGPRSPSVSDTRRSDEARETPSTERRVSSSREERRESGPKTPTHPVSRPSQIQGALTPQFVPAQQSLQTRCRSSSPLKHEYEPSSASSSVKSDILFDDGASISSESSAGEYMVDPALPLSQLHIKAAGTRSVSKGVSKSPAASVSPSQSASQSGVQVGAEKKEQVNKTIASIFRWSERGKWEPLHPDECSIVVSPGLIEAFELTAAHSKPIHGGLSDSSGKPRPLIAQELTPLVPLRRGTAIDITIRSPPSQNSLLRQGSNIMYRSRNGQECEVLYGMINHARIYNPTYIALQNERGPQGSNWGTFMDRQASQRGARSWWRLGSKKSSYRAGSTRKTYSTAHQTESSVASLSSAISALRRFTSGSKMFNVGKSTISSRGHLTRSSGSFSSGAASRPTSPPEPGIDPSQGTPAGIANAKIRFYQRESATKWKDMGAARLTIMHLPGATVPLPSGHLRQEKRVVVVGKTYGEKLLDVTLGESSFERVARTGIAVSMWEQLKDPKGNVIQIGNTGGVIPATTKVYMLQMKSEAEAAYTFSLVGRLRY